MSFAFAPLTFSSINANCIYLFAFSRIAYFGPEMTKRWTQIWNDLISCILYRSTSTLHASLTKGSFLYQGLQIMNVGYSNILTKQTAQFVAIPSSLTSSRESREDTIISKASGSWIMERMSLKNMEEKTVRAERNLVSLHLLSHIAGVQTDRWTALANSWGGLGRPVEF